MTEPDRCRFCRLFAWSLLGFSALLGVLINLPGGHDELAFLGFTENAVRALAPAAVGSAFLLALVIWSQALAPARAQSELKRIATRGFLVSFPGYAIALASILGIGAVVSAALGLPSSLLPTALGRLTVRLLLIGLASTACDAALIVVLAWRYLPRLRAMSASLPMKLVLVLTLSTPIRAALAVFATSLLVR